MSTRSHPWTTIYQWAVDRESTLACNLIGISIAFCKVPCSALTLGNRDCIACWATFRQSTTLEFYHLSRNCDCLVLYSTCNNNELIERSVVICQYHCTSTFLIGNCTRESLIGCEIFWIINNTTILCFKLDWWVCCYSSFSTQCCTILNNHLICQNYISTKVTRVLNITCQSIYVEHTTRDACTASICIVGADSSSTSSALYQYGVACDSTITAEVVSSCIVEDNAVCLDIWVENNILYCSIVVEYHLIAIHEVCLCSIWCHSEVLGISNIPSRALSTCPYNSWSIANAFYYEV